MSLLATYESLATGKINLDEAAQAAATEQEVALERVTRERSLKHGKRATTNVS